MKALGSKSLLTEGPRQAAKRAYTLNKAGDFLGALELLRAQQDESLDPILAMQLSYVGEYEGARRSFTQEPPVPAPTEQEVQALRSAVQAEPAVEALCRIAREQHLLVINEAHHAAHHRALGLRLLPCLRAAGFTHAAFEGLAEPGEQVRQRGRVALSSLVYPEPQFAALVQGVIAEGLVPVAYEADLPDTPNLLFEERMRLRELEQARNLRERVFSPSPQARVLVWVGYNHVAERAEATPEGEARLGGLLKKQTGRDPYTVAQDFDVEPSRLVELVRAAFPSPEPVLVDLHRAWPALSPQVREEIDRYGYGNPGVDAVLIHPSRKPGDSRAEWLRAGDSAPVQVDCGGCKPEPLLVQLFHPEDDPAQVLPVDQVLCARERPCVDLVAPPARYRVLVRGLQGIRLDEVREVTAPLVLQFGP